MTLTARDRRPLAGPALTATYRLQLHAGFGFDRARALVPYLCRLGVSHLYLSPVLAARPGSTHGYDVVDPTRANPELGGDEGWAALVDAVRRHGMGIVVDIVPNHMGLGHANPYWTDVLARGRESPYADWFDIDWEAPHARGRLVLPVLGDDLAAVLDRGELTLGVADGRVVVHYYESHFPLDPRTVHHLLAGDHVQGEPEGAPSGAEWTAARDRLAPAGDDRPDLDRADAGVAALVALVERDPAHRARLDALLAAFAAGEAGRRRLQALLDRQLWRLTHWKDAVRELHVRRFFDVNELIALRVEDPAVFAARHRWLLERVAAGEVDAVRVDHVDGLRDPHDYLARLRAALDEQRPERRVPIFVEKILSPGERLRPEWPIDGTTGYEALNDLESAFVDADGYRRIALGYRRLLRARPESASFHEVARRGKELVLRQIFRPELRRLVQLLLPVARAAGLRMVGGPGARLAPLLSEALLEVAAALPVYRTYVRPAGAGRDAPLVADAEDRALMATTVARWTERGPVEPRLRDFLVGVLLGDRPGPDAPPAVRRAAREVAIRFQQASGPATAKGIEDTAHYRWFPVASLNEVGGEPDRPLDDAVERLHAAAAERQRDWPRSLVTVTTHDTKRTADVRARLDALADLPGEWLDAVTGWHRRHAVLRVRAGRRWAPDANTEYLLYQTVLGIWPVGADGAATGAAADGELVERVCGYLTKAMREAKAQSSWVAPNAGYEQGVLDFARALLAGEAGATFRRELAPLATRVARAGGWTSLARTLVQLAGPGVPDVYQGDELFTLALVDPDNRRAVDWGRRAALLAELDAASRDPEREPLDGGVGGGAPGAELPRRHATDADKLALVRSLLGARRADPLLFERGEHVPLRAEGRWGAHVIAFARVCEERAVVAVAPRRTLLLRPDGLAPLAADWGDTTLALPPALTGGVGASAGALVDLLGGPGGGAAGTVRLADLLTERPLAVLATAGSPVAQLAQGAQLSLAAAG